MWGSWLKVLQMLECRSDATFFHSAVCAVDAEAGECGEGNASQHRSQQSQQSLATPESPEYRSDAHISEWNTHLQYMVVWST